MKRAKIMLMSVAVLATVGSALAFKVVKGNLRLCYVQTTVQPNPTAKACPNTLESASGVVGTGFYYTTLTEETCADQTNCINPASDFTE